MSDETLRVWAREAVLAGRLPTTRPERIWGGPGIGARCAVCDQPIEPHQSELELQFAHRSKRVHSNGEESVVAAEGNYLVHVSCFAAWEYVRKNGHGLPVDCEQGIMNRSECTAANGARAGGPHSGDSGQPALSQTDEPSSAREGLGYARPLNGDG